MINGATEPETFGLFILEVNIDPRASGCSSGTSKELFDPSRKIMGLFFISRIKEKIEP